MGHRRFSPSELARLYFLLQGVAGLLWWVGVFLSPVIRRTTLGHLPLEIAFLDLPLFVGGSFWAAMGKRGPVATVLAWTLAVTLGMAVYATTTREAAWGMLLMAAATGGTLLAAAVFLLGRVPTEWLIQGPFVFRTTTDTNGHFLRTVRQLLAFWITFLGILPTIIVFLERRWRLDVPFPLGLRLLGGVLFVLAGALGIGSSWTMARIGEGSPLPATMAKRLVIQGPYRVVRNPMAVAGIVQGASVGLIAASWMVVVYALIGSGIWNAAIRPHEEADLARRFGEEFEAYRRSVSCWIPQSCYLRKRFPTSSR